MAVTQISRIQVRRGRKNLTGAIPQLASGELAWAVDSQELYIGNGSVAEGAPFVGNTRIITENDNILQLISGYRFSEGSNSIFTSVKRSLQSKLDEYVSVTDFGAVGDNSTDNTEAFTNAFEELYKNANTVFRKVLLIPNGTYRFDSGLNIPSFATLQGETSTGVVLRLNGNTVTFVTPTTDVVEEFTEEDHPTQITFSNLSIQDGNFSITGSKKVYFNDVTFEGSYEVADLSEDWEEETAVFSWTNQQEGLKVTDVEFDSCVFKNQTMIVKATQTEVYDTSVRFLNCKFDSIETGIYVIGVQNQINKWLINDCEFRKVVNYSVYFSQGTDTLIKDSRFEDCGNIYRIDNSGAEPVTVAIPERTVIYFGQSRDNIVLDCYSDRQRFPAGDAISVNSSNYVPEVFNAVKATFIGENYSQIGPSVTPTPIAMFSSSNNYIELDYVIRLNIGDVRRGKLIITIDRTKDTGALVQPPTISLSDNYSYNSPLGVAEGTITGSSLEITGTPLGTLSVGSVIVAGPEGLISETTITEIVSVADPAIGTGTYTVNKFYEASITATNVRPFRFTRDSSSSLEFEAILVDNFPTDDDGIAETVILRYRNPQPNQLLTGADEFGNPIRGPEGYMTYKVTYGV
jgi:hypothetical protein